MGIGAIVDKMVADKVFHAAAGACAGVAVSCMPYGMYLDGAIWGVGAVGIEYVLYKYTQKQQKIRELSDKVHENVSEVIGNLDKAANRLDKKYQK
jgi:hypothetical protein